MATLYKNFRWWEDGQPQEMLVDDGRVVWRESPRPGGAEEGCDLGSKTLQPSFIDAHCHILPTGLDLQKLDLSAAKTHTDVLDLVAQRHAGQSEGWLLAVQYDQTKFEGGQHLTRYDLDRISADRPILLRHANGHASVANTAALALAQVNDATPDPAGGKYGRDSGGVLDGTLFEEAHERVSHVPPTPSMAEMAEAIEAAGEKMADLGICCASDMMTGRYHLANELDAYAMAARNGCPISMRLYLQWKDVFGPRAQPLEALRSRIASLEADSHGKVRVAGIKIFADGAIGSATAAMYGRYSGETPAGPILSRRAQAARHEAREVSGQVMYAPERLIDMTRTAAAQGFQVAIHAIGDYATDLVLDAFESTDQPSMHRLEHGMILSDAQIERIAKLGCFLTFQPEFLMRFAHSYRRQLGPERTSKLKRTRSVLDAGIPLSFSSDRPIVPGDPRDGIRTAICRPEGFDAGENCTLAEAIYATTRESAKVNGDAQAMGSLTEGQDARFITYESLLD
jgi:predicted amidohydrolase YtcJ